MFFNNPKRLKELDYALHLFYDDQGILRLKGRLQNTNKKFDEKYPIFLDKDSYFTNLVILDCHNKVGHSRMKDTWNQLRSKYWVTQGRRTVNRVIQKCTKCSKFDSKAFKLLPAAPLPKFRVEANFPFTSCGIDYMSFCTHARHHDLFTDLSCTTFVRSLKRFINRYGLSKLYVSDNATCFTGPELKSFIQSVESKWKFILEASPWWGGYWERLVQSCKRILRKVLGKAKLTYEELLTVIAKVGRYFEFPPSLPYL